MKKQKSAERYIFGKALCSLSTRASPRWKKRALKDDLTHLRKCLYALFAVSSASGIISVCSAVQNRVVDASLLVPLEGCCVPWGGGGLEPFCVLCAEFPPCTTTADHSK